MQRRTEDEHTKVLTAVRNITDKIQCLGQISTAFDQGRDARNILEHILVESVFSKVS